MTWTGKALIIGAASLAVVTAPAGAATLVASYLFDNTLSSGVAGAPTLIATDPTGTSGFITSNVLGTTRTVYHVGGTNANDQQGGLTFASTGLLPTDSYSVALTIEFTERDGAWRRILDVQDRMSDNGFYVSPSNDLTVFGAGGSAGNYVSGTYRNIVLTVGPSGPNNVSAYIDGGASLSVATDIMDIGPSGAINLFLDNVLAGGQGEWSQANIAVAKFYSGVLTADEVAAINGDPTAPPPATVPEPASWALMVAGFGLVGMGLRARRRTVAFG